MKSCHSFFLGILIKWPSKSFLVCDPTNWFMSSWFMSQITVWYQEVGTVYGDIPPPAGVCRSQRGFGPRPPQRSVSAFWRHAPKPSCNLDSIFPKTACVFFVGKCCRPALHAGPKMVGCAIVQAGVGVVVPPLWPEVSQLTYPPPSLISNHAPDLESVSFWRIILFS